VWCQPLFADAVILFYCPIMEDACGSMVMMPTNSMQPLLRIDCISQPLNIMLCLNGW
jgi:hypothetical protein